MAWLNISRTGAMVFAMVLLLSPFRTIAAMIALMSSRVTPSNRFPPDQRYNMVLQETPIVVGRRLPAVDVGIGP
jgi:hypothetical protein